MLDEDNLFLSVTNSGYGFIHANERYRFCCYLNTSQIQGITKPKLIKYLLDLPVATPIMLSKIPACVQ